MARMRPDLFHAYVGAGQVVSGEANEAVGYARLLAKLRAAGATKDAAALARVGPPPYAGREQIVAERRILMRHPPASERGIMGRLIRALLFAPGLSLGQLRDYAAAMGFSSRMLLQAVLTYEDPKPYAPFEVPVVFIQGAEDIQTPTSLVETYCAEITAPSKAMVLLPGGGHWALGAMPDAFLAALLTHVAPLAKA
jgi:pimeloyl-ACP methyl ester carboxylesterase